MVSSSWTNSLRPSDDESASECGLFLVLLLCVYSAPNITYRSYSYHTLESRMWAL
jgi:hypothetical protein